MMFRSNMTRRNFLATVGAGLAAYGMHRRAVAAPRTPGDRPNFVIVFTDDQGYRDVGCFGAEGFETPNLDRMSAEGVRFTDFYSAAPSCTPSRTALITGCYPTRVGLPHVLGPSANIGINDEEATIAEVMKTRGYATACFGKWHLGHHKKFLPVHHGFDEYFGLPYSNDMWPRHPTSDRFPPLPLIEGDEIIQYNPDQRQLTTWYTEHAVDFIKAHKDEPFLVYLPHSMPHVPLHVSEKFAGRSEQGMYGDVIMEIDWSVGQILSTLRELGLDKNTLVVFTSDNGPWLSYGDHAGCALPLREGKGTTFDGGQREPFIAWWPEQIPAGTVCHEMAAMFDLLPTFAGLAGAELDGSRKIDGKDIWPLLSGVSDATTPHEAFFYHRGGRLEAVRSGKWKLHMPHKYRSLGPEGPGSGGWPAPYEMKEIGWALFDLDNDIGETTNVADKHPDVVERLKKLLKEFQKDIKENSRAPGRA
ncbi:MAG: sulfatase [Candidatus Hydrogenedentota bacterium]